MENLNWFKFSPSSWVMGKIQKVPEITQARFMRLSCLYWNKGCVLSIEDAEIEIDKEHLDILLSKKILKTEGENIIIDFLDEQRKGIEEVKNDKRRAANKRWEKHKKSTQEPKENNADVMHMHTDAMQNDADKRREEEIRENNNNLSVNWHALLEQFNSITGKKLKLVPDKARRQIKARLKEGYTKEDLVTAIVNCFNDSYHRETGHKYLTLEFISRPDKLEKYATMNPDFKPIQKEARL